jgi:mono/diheme cytochrome c family protein
MIPRAIQVARSGAYVGAILFLGFILFSVQVSLAQNKSAVEKGSKLFKQHCAVCHGVDAKGNGPAAKTLKVAPADLTAIQLPGQKFPAVEVTNTISGEKVVAPHGTREMPIWGKVFRQPLGEPFGQIDINCLTKYIEDIQKNKQEPSKK